MSAIEALGINEDNELEAQQYNPFADLKTVPADQLFGLKQKIKEIKAENPDVEVVDLTLGVYRDNNGKPYKFQAVAEAEKRIGSIANVKDNPEYLPIAGDPEFLDASTRVIFGEEHPILNEPERISRLATPGGTGGLFLAAKTLEKLQKDTGKKVNVFYGEPTWPNHLAIFGESGKLGMFGYKHLDDNKDAQVKGLRSSLEGINGTSNEPAISAALFHGKCHNPTGTDYSPEQIEELIEILKEHEVQAIVDMAYQGFGDGLNEDAHMARRFVEAGIPTMITYSFSKNQSQYQNRDGMFLSVSQDADTATRIQKNAEKIARRTWSNPPAHGQFVTREILGSEHLMKLWMHDVDLARNNLIKRCRRLVKLTGEHFKDIEKGNGLFRILPLTRLQVDNLMHLYEDDGFDQEAAIAMPYIKGYGGRLNLGGVNDQQLALLAKGLNYVKGKNYGTS